MRYLLLLLLVGACSSKSPSLEARATEQCPPDPVAAPPAAVEPELDLHVLMARCPVGDFVNTTVYRFLERELEEAASEDGGRAATLALLAREAELLKQPDMKPRRASIIEGETSHILATLCKGTPGCKAIGVYNKSGLAIALSFLDGNVAPLGFDDARWATLTAVGAEGAKLALAAAEAETLAVGDHALVVVPAEHGLAACIIDN